MRGEKGFSLIEVLVAVALVGLISVALIVALATASKVLIIADERTTAESLARSQMEYIKIQPYDDFNEPPEYAQLSLPTYDIEVTAERLDPEGDGSGDDDGLQKITVTVEHHDKEIVTLEGYRVDR